MISSTTNYVLGKTTDFLLPDEPVDNINKPTLAAGTYKKTQECENRVSLDHG